MQECNQCLFKIDIADSVQPRIHSTVIRPFCSWEGGVWAQD